MSRTSGLFRCIWLGRASRVPGSTRSFAPAGTLRRNHSGAGAAEGTRDLSGIKRTSVAWIYTTNVNGQGDTTVNLAGFIKGEVNGSWKPRTATQYVETTDPMHFTNLSNTFHIPLSDWGVL